MLSLRDRIIERWRNSSRRRLLRIVRSDSIVLTIIFWTDVLLSAVLPYAAFGALSLLIRRTADGIGVDETSLLEAELHPVLVLVLATSVVAVVAPGVHECIAAIFRVRLTATMQRRLLRAVSRPVGIAHLEDPAVHNRLALARGSLMSYFPADAPAVYASVLATRLSWLVGCCALGTFRPWLGASVFLLWACSRRPILRGITKQVQAMGGDAEIMRRAQYFADLSFNPDAAKEVRLFGLGDWVRNQFLHHHLEGMAGVWRDRRAIARNEAFIAVAVIAVYIGSACAIGLAAYSGEVGLDELAFLLPALALTATTGAVAFDDVLLEWQLGGVPALVSIETDLHARQQGSTGTKVPPLGVAREIRFERVSFSYPGSDHVVLRGLDLVLEAGTSTAVVGLNGAGKTTLIKLLCRFHDPQDGRILVDGIELAQLDPDSWRRGMAAVVQGFMRAPLTAAENVAFGAWDARDDITGLRRAAERAGVLDDIEGLPRGWDTPLSPRLSGGVDLSGGQWQKVALARALFATDHGASILVLDEPTAAVDVRSEVAFYDRFLDLTRGATTLVISHRFSSVRRADQICVLDDGAITERGTHRELLDLRGTYARMFNLQAARFNGDSDDVELTR